MNSNPQRPENIPPPIEPVGIFSGVQIRPIIAGMIVDYIATFVAGTVFIIIFFGQEIVKQGKPSEEAFNKILTSPEHLFILGAVGALCTVLGGYVAGRIAKNLEIKHGALVGLGSLILVTLEQVISGKSTSYPLWFEILGYLMAVPAGALGGYVAQRQRELTTASASREGDRPRR
jgi:putative membrane protein (TIGR04086 family)